MLERKLLFFLVLVSFLLLLNCGSDSVRVKDESFSGFENIKQVSAGVTHVVALTTDGTVWSWGSNESGKIGDAELPSSAKPLKIEGLTNVVYVVAGWKHSVALKDDGTVWAWGHNEHGQLGDSTTINSNIPVQVRNLTDVKSITAGSASTIAVKNDGTVWTWGNSLYKTYVSSDVFAYPIQITELSNASKVVSGGRQTLVLKTDGTVWGWGFNVFGQIGAGPGLIFCTTPVQVNNLDNIIEIAANLSHSLALKNDGTVYSWGWARNNLLGYEYPVSSNFTPQIIPNLDDVKSIEAGRNHTLVLKNDGTIWGFGSNTVKQLANDTITTTSPVAIPYFDNIKSISTKGNYNIVLKNDGTLWGWGQSQFGELGKLGIDYKTTPTKTVNITDVKKVVAGLNHTVAIKNDETVWSWGNNVSGQLADGTSGGNDLYYSKNIDKNYPVQSMYLSNIY